MKRSSSLPMSPLTGGINRNEQEARKDQAVEAENVIEEGGDVRRRPVFRSIGTAAPHYIPDVTVKHYSFATNVWTNLGIGIGTLAAGTWGGADNSGVLLIGSNQKFDGFDLPNPSPIYPRPAGRRYLLPEVIRATTFTEAGSRNAAGLASSVRSLPWFLDTTLESLSGTLNARHTLSRPGRVSWHRSTLPEWSLIELDGSRLYWMALNLSNVPYQDDTVRAYAASL